MSMQDTDRTDRTLLRRLQSRRLERDARLPRRRRRARSQPGPARKEPATRSAHSSGAWTRAIRSSCDDIVALSNADGSRAGAEYVVHGTYKVSDEGLPPAKGQKYVLPGGAFFDIRGGKIARVTNYYNLQDWIAQVGG